MAKKKIWIVTELFYPDETSTAFILTKIANKLCEKYKVEVFCGEPDLERVSNNDSFKLNPQVQTTYLKTFLKNKNNLVFRTFSFLLLSFSFFWKLLFNVRKGDKVFVVTNPAPLIVISSLIRRLKDIELIILVHDVFPENTIPAGIIKSKDNFLYKFLSSIFNKSYSRADKIIVLGRDMKNVIADKIQKYSTSDKISTIENWADTDNIYPVESLNKSDKIIFQYAGNIGRVQGLLEFLNVIKNITNLDLEFHFIGNGAVKSQMQQFTKDNHLKNVKFFGSYQRDEQNEILTNCDFAIITLSEGMYGLGVPSKTYNVLAAGKPIFFIGNPESEIALLVREQGIGYVFDNNDKSMLKFFNEMNISKQQLQHMSKRCRSLAETKYSEEIILNKFADLI